MRMCLLFCISLNILSVNTTARLFEREEGNLAYDYGDKFLRPKLGTQKVYVITKDDNSDGDMHRSKANDSDEDENWKELLTKWGLKKFIDAFDDNGYDDPQFWHEIEESELTDDMGMKKGHLRKWNMQIEKYQARLALKEQREEKEEMANEGGMPPSYNQVVMQQQQVMHQAPQQQPIHYVEQKQVLPTSLM